MTHTISVDDATFATLKKLANDNGRTVVGQIRWLLGGQRDIAPVAGIHALTSSGDRDKSIDESSELQQMINRLQYFDEGSPEYEEAMARISELQK